MRKILAAAVAALTFGWAVLSASAPAQAQSHGGFRGGGGGFHGGGFRGGGGGFRGGGFRGGGFRGGRGWGGDGALFAGVTGLALGAALASPYYYGYGSGYGYDPYYYGPPAPYYYGPGYGFCYGRARVWDPEIGRYVFERARVPC